ncbi:MAG: PspC domain-containing protein [Candidatus Cyclonatronum sp.]|uniref:PspC domain-containing protein n=1 Tax=Cyclonatronum sp. TaxID=3024185 RepID=UPI0025BA3182|nr:PspC domain-containing protein [Cyclonatronum sp.]MCC5934522.1 PspC domain-containing protein [Balneolales bacterium]MCH8486551.1 PspC domain-containing protein [Cyclonatronum sp.]
MAKLKRSTSDKMLFGVCGGLARHFDMDATLIRVIWAILVVVGWGSPILVYLIMAIIMPPD